MDWQRLISDPSRCLARRWGAGLARSDRRRQRVRHLTWVAIGAVLAFLVVVTVAKYLTVPVDIRELNLPVRR